MLETGPTLPTAPAVPASTAPPAPRFSLGFHVDNGVLVIRKTGVRLPIDGALFAEVLQWAWYLPLLAAVGAFARLRRLAAPKRIWFAPDAPGPWYLLRGAAIWGGIATARSPRQADAAFYFEDSTRGAAPLESGVRLLNGCCSDISKSRVADVFAEVFGYPLRLDPACAEGPIVEKAEKNGVHDGRIVTAPLKPRPGYTYQRLIDTADAAGLVHDLRTPCAGGAPVVVWEKTKPAAKRFAIHNCRAVLRDPGAVYSADELKMIREFSRRMGLDWGGLDILRDRGTGRIYIVDVNKTDLGPVIALSWTDKLRSMQRLSRALARLVDRAAG